MSSLVMNEYEKTLFNIYYKEQFYAGRDKLFIKVEKKIPIRFINNWLQHQALHQMFLLPKPSHVVKPTILGNPGEQIAIDVTFFSDQRGNKYIFLVAVDLFTKMVDARILPDQRYASVERAMKEMIEKKDAILIPDGPKNIEAIRSDNGTNLIPLKRYFKKHHIRQILSSPYMPSSNGGVERMNGRIKRLLRRHITQTGKVDIPHQLTHVLDVINNSQHSITKQKPVDVLTSVKSQIIANKNIRYFWEQRKKKNRHKCNIRVGDKVRVTTRILAPPKTIWHNWSKMVFEVIEKANENSNHVLEPTYKIKDKWGYMLIRRFACHELLKIKTPKNRKEVNIRNRYYYHEFRNPAVISGVPTFLLWDRRTEGRGYISVNLYQIWAENTKAVEDIVKKHEINFFGSKVSYLTYKHDRKTLILNEIPTKEYAIIQKPSALDPHPNPIKKINKKSDLD
jgi:transposase InsO family protein